MLQEQETLNKKLQTLKDLAGDLYSVWEYKFGKGFGNQWMAGMFGLGMVLSVS